MSDGIKLDGNVCVGSYIIAGLGDPPKAVDPRPVGIRWQVRNGVPVLQFAQAWHKGFVEHGIEWLDVPTEEVPPVSPV